jgi:NadR type nicotinamide-nucleotide adenylyltransferase
MEIQGHEVAYKTLSYMSSSNIKKVVIIGPESTGKSSLCAALSEYYGTIWCPEYAREYLLKNGRDYKQDDLLSIAKGQIRLEEEHAKKMTAVASSKYLFIDTDMYVMKVWSEFVFGQCHKFILDQIVTRKYDAYVLCKPDIPWVQDELREYPDETTRIRLYHYYKDLMIHQSTPWVEIDGDYIERTQKAIGFVEGLR